jgi:hypothetical protein
MSQPLLTFAGFLPGTLMGVRESVLDEASFRRWFALFPEDEHGETMPAGMVAAVTMRAYSEILVPRPPGNVHGAQRFDIERLPRLGDRLVTELRCAEKNVKRERNWVTFETLTRAPAGQPFFSGRMTVLWAA